MTNLFAKNCNAYGEICKEGLRRVRSQESGVMSNESGVVETPRLNYN
ncbi:MAG: hypothetical protein AAFX80_23680 [Cyanobacteria bacterium J06639_18]